MEADLLFIAAGSLAGEQISFSARGAPPRLLAFCVSCLLRLELTASGMPRWCPPTLDQAIVKECYE